MNNSTGRETVPAYDPTFSENRGKPIGRFLGGLRELVLIPVIIVLLIFGTYMHASFLTWGNIVSNILGTSSVLAILVVAQSILLIAKRFDLSLQSTVALAPMISIMFVLPKSAGGVGVEMNQVAGLALLFAVAMSIGAVNGLLVSRLRLNAFMVTLAMLILLQGVTLGISSGRTITDLPVAYRFIGETSYFGMPLEVWISVAVVGFASYFMRFQPLGRDIYAIGGNEEAARAAGVRVERVVFGLFVVAGALAGLAGLILSSRIASVSPNQGADIIFTVFAASVVGGIDLNGGRGRIVGAATGVLLLGIIQNLLVLSYVPPFWVTAIYGAVILFSLMLSALAGGLQFRSRA